jgi:hypothetical protein
MTQEQYDKASELLGKIERIQTELTTLEDIQQYSYPSFSLSGMRGSTCSIPPEIEEDVYGLIKTEYCKQLEALKKELEEL